MAIKADPLVERRIKACNTAEEFWKLLMEVVPTNSRAYLGSVLKQGAPLLRQRQILLPDERLGRFCAQGSEIDRAKVLDFLLACPTTATYYEAFQLFKHMSDKRAVLYTYCQRLMSEGSDLSYNMASVMSLYFDLQLPATFALRVEPYQLSRLEGGYDDFKKILKP